MAVEDLNLEFEDEHSEKDKSEAVEVDVDLSFAIHTDSNQEDFSEEEDTTPIISNPLEVDEDILPKNKKINISEDDITDPSYRLPKELHKNTASSPQNKNDLNQENKAKQEKVHNENVKSLNEARRKAQELKNKKALQHKNQPETLNINQKEAIKNSKLVEKESPTPKTEVSASLDSPGKNAQDDKKSYNLMQSHELAFYQKQVENLSKEIRMIQKEMYEVSMHAEVRAQIAEMKLELMLEILTSAEATQLKVNQMIQRIHQKAPALKPEVLNIKRSLQEHLEVIKTQKAKTLKK